jgi:tetratricopeptide (TPR) repeat protein
LFCSILVMFHLTAIGQIPELKVSGSDANVNLHDLKIDIQVIGNIATTTMQMTFSNPNNRLLEGELVFPLPEGASVSRYGLDINGSIREAVPVEKEKGARVFEAIERKRADPGLLEKVEGNQFRTRIYPIPAGGNRVVLIGYEQELSFNDRHSLRYILPMNYKKILPHFHLHVSVLQSTLKPEMEQSPDDNFSFGEWNNNYNASLDKDDYLCDRSLSFSVPKTPGNMETLMQKKGGNYYFVINAFPRQEEREKVLPHHITILWDASLSSVYREPKKEIALLNEYIHQIDQGQIILVSFSNTIIRQKDFTFSHGNWDDCRNELQHITYDGGTQLGALDLRKLPGEEILLFSDGHSTFGGSDMGLSDKPVYTINTSAKADYSNLRYISQATGGAFIDLSVLTLNDAKKRLCYQSLEFLGVKPDASISECYPSIPFGVINNCSIAGISTDPGAIVTLQFGYGKTVILEKRVKLDYDKGKTSQADIAHVWAGKKINELDIRYEQNAALIGQLGKQFSIVTRNTSLIVLENVTDYLQYEIEPPAELREEYDRLLKERVASRQTARELAINNALSYSDQLMEWWDKKFEWTPPAPKHPDHYTLLDTARGQAPVMTRDSSIAAGTITGRVFDQGNQPLAGASVHMKGTREGVSTDAQGRYRITYRGIHPVLVFSYVGMEIKEVKAKHNNVVNVHLNPATQDLNDVVVIGYGAERREDLTGSVSSPGNVAYYALPATAVGRNTNGVGAAADKKSSSERSGDTAYVELKEWSPDRPYLKEIDKAPVSEQYGKYLELRKDQLLSPGFYYDMAGFFYKQKDSVTALRILSNLAELNIEDHELYKLLGFKLRETGAFAEAVDVFRKVLQWRPQEPQSYRDYGLALADAGKYQNALDTLLLAIHRDYDANIAGKNNGIEETIVTEINDLVDLHGARLNDQAIDRKLLHKMPVDIRVVAAWNMDNTDMDLWMTDPNGEKCYYSHKSTAIGGHLSNDITQGYGPEQFLLKRAIKGKYKIEMNYYGDRQFKIAGPTTVMIEIYTHYGEPRQERKIITLQMQKGQTGGILIGEFNFD